MDVLIIGAGPTGLTAATALASKGIICRVVERKSEPSELSRAVGIMPVTIDALKSLGVADAFLAEAMPLRKMHVLRDEKTLVYLDNSGNEYRDRVPLGLPQNRTEGILRDALMDKGVQVEYDLSVTKISTSADKAEVHFSDNTSGEFDWVIAADGIQSTVREQLQIGYPGIDLPGKWSIADVDIVGDFDSEEITLDLYGRDCQFTLILPIEKYRARIASSTEDALGNMRLPLNIGSVRRTGTFQISIRQAETYRKNRVLLAGDAAHCHSPVGGKGMNLGMADAIAAAMSIVYGNVDQYSYTRRKVGASVVKKTEIARYLISSENPLAKSLFWFSAKCISSIPPLHRAFMKQWTSV
ncbi:NAD(P)/FAD-dependent oxidoreductase [Microbulbifer sp. MLAF003]|uniref:FAD-dependent oxidoreductase n=1 Tax=unclassified Microbulbifer TaxID=2619833 RepID=UPI0024ADF511|nr:NAD(P)/FAD-dependent oxidoreductase [Microbulbifer sp. MLAF003]WHI53316.1 NAD(P)/FAD-dependent oxidoreductase [Microbulbifer sp. MLAF003]